MAAFGQTGASSSQLQKLEFVAAFSCKTTPKDRLARFVAVHTRCSIRQIGLEAAVRCTKDERPLWAQGGRSTPNLLTTVSDCRMSKNLSSRLKLRKHSRRGNVRFRPPHVVDDAAQGLDGFDVRNADFRYWPWPLKLARTKCEIIGDTSEQAGIAFQH